LLNLRLPGTLSVVITPDLCPNAIRFIFACLCLLLLSLLYRVRYLQYSPSSCSTLTLWVARDLLSYSPFLSRDAYPSLGLSTKKLTWSTYLRGIFLMKASPASSLPKGKEGFGLYRGLNIVQRRGRTIFVPLWCLSVSRGRGGLISLVLGVYTQEGTCSGCLQCV